MRILVVNPISWRGGGMLAAVGAVFITPRNLFNSPAVIHYTLDVLASFIGPLFGILVVDFANFVWFIGAAVGGVVYRLIAEVMAPAAVALAASPSGGAAE